MSAHVDEFRSVSADANCRSKRLRMYLTRFRREERGSILIMSLFFLILMLIVAGMSVDLMRSETQRARLQSTLDRAVLAAASLEQSLDSEEVVRDYFAKAGLSEYLTDVKVVDNKNSKTVSASVESSVNTMFMKMMGINELTAPSAGQAEESLKNIEISLVLDISGSMGWWSDAGGDYKIDLLQDAASQFVYLMQCNPEATDATKTCTVEPNTVSISLIPYAEQVLVGENLLQHFNVTNEHTASSCVTFDASDFAKTTVPLNSAYTVGVVDTLQRTGNIDTSTNYRSSRSSSKNANDSSRVCRTNSYREILPLSNSYTDLQTQIYNLRANGYTSIDLGMKWATALLDPSIRPAVLDMTVSGLPSIDANFNDRPYDYDERSMQKVIVLMTDGENTTQHYLNSGYHTGPSIFYTNDNGSISSSDVVISAYSASKNQYYYNRGWHNEAYGDGTDRVCNWWSCWNEAQPGEARQMTYQEFWAQYNVDFYEEEFYERQWSYFPDMVDTYGYSTKNSRLNSICTAAKNEGIEVFTIGFETTSASNAIMRSCASADSYHFDVNGLDLDDAFNSIAREIHELRLTL